ncbi:flavodoxin family protein [Flammeovirga aprica]|uniref:NAD(P)H-dependent oxidoreductase n=1 Tax=Flammeovirga aprica JL-4 TaxID=694437 RepID=A0A7X9XAG9_9BACT|nr:NAD(P)H-dependent oxidoreductase [Flammeovirga aprica]NME69655.1 NAD(P)H-dependent oxidoreductase [Flammeovirga aprica JL-4]
MKSVIIVGSARNESNTLKLAQTLQMKGEFDVINLFDYQIGHFDYEHQNKEDDFLPLMKKIIEKYDTIVLATPVYWYAMSGRMKVFFDRITDLITIEKELGRKLRGKNMAVITTSNGGNLGDDFWHPFKHSASYLGMNFLGGEHTINDLDSENAISSFLDFFSEK